MKRVKADDASVRIVDRIDKQVIKVHRHRREHDDHALVQRVRKNSHARRHRRRRPHNVYASEIIVSVKADLSAWTIRR